MFFVFGCLLPLFNVHADTDRYYTVKNLQDEWQVYDKYYQAYIPYIANGKTLYKGGLYLSKRNDQEYFLSFYSTKGMALFIENKLIYKHISDTPPKRVRITLQSLSDQIAEDPFLIVFHNSQSGIYLDSACLQIKLPLNTAKNQTKTLDSQSINVRENSFNREGFIISFLIFTSLLIFYKFVFMKGRTLINVGLDRNMELLLLDRSGAMSIVLIIINAVLFMMLFYLMANEHITYFNIPFRKPLQHEKEISYVFYLLLTFGMMQTLKIIYVKIINTLTFSSGVSPLQNYLLLNYLFQVGLFFFPVILVICLLPSTYIIKIAEIAPITLFLLLVIISLLTSYMIYSRSELRNIYLFSYICTAEIVPLGIAFRVFLG
ncbi:MAG: DUF4271 domain-containing protein [Cytophagales bacterium]|nr:DUF4271 domain-containing protein [Cytophaga sp.]